LVLAHREEIDKSLVLSNRHPGEAAEQVFSLIKDQDPVLLEAGLEACEKADELALCCKALDASSFLWRQDSASDDRFVERMQIIESSEYALPYQKKAAQRALTKVLPRSGYVYLVGNSEQPYFKIGMSVNPDSRVCHFEPKLPFPVSIIHTTWTVDRYKGEAYLHRRFEEKRSNGEWFELDQDDISWIKAWDGQFRQVG